MCQTKIKSIRSDVLFMPFQMLIPTLSVDLSLKSYLVVLPGNLKVLDEQSDMFARRAKRPILSLKPRFHGRANPSCSSSLSTFERHVQLTGWARQGRFFARPGCTIDLHDRGNPSSSSGEQKVCLAPLASELHVTFKSGKRQAARWICTSVETRL
jgi:hypothetical protein